MKRILALVLFLMLVVFVLDHSFFIAKTGAVLTLLALVGVSMYILIGSRK